MPQIIWRPIQDEIDRLKFVSAAPEGWTFVDGWSGRDMDDPAPLYMLELIERDDQKAGILRKLVQVPGTRAVIRPVEAGKDLGVYCAPQLGFEQFKTEAFGAYGLWIKPL